MMNATQRVFWLVILGFLTGPLGHAQTNPPVITAPLDVTAAVLKGVQFFRTYAATNDEAWLCHPIPGKKVTGYRTTTYRYKMVEVVIPGHKYQAYEVLVPGNSPADPMQKVTRYRIIGRDPSKDRKETREVRDPNGPIAREVKLPIYEKDTGHEWRLGGLGNNGWAILALRRCGVPGDDSLLFEPANNLAHMVITFGWPDNLHDLAGLTAGFAVLPGGEFKRLAEIGAAKLLDAQITTGPAAGLWGPVAVNPAMVSAFLKSLSRLGDEKKALTAELADARRKKLASKVKRLEEDIQRIGERSEALQMDAKRVTQMGLRLFDALGHRHRGSRIRFIDQAETLELEAWPYLVHNQITGDLDSTAEAILALRIAFENGRLPARTWRPDPPKPTGPGQPPMSDFPPPREARDVVALAFKAVSAARTADGQWPELNIHQPVTDFAWLKTLPQLNPATAPKLRQPVTLASTMRGAASLANLQMLQAGAPRPTALENPAYQPLLDGMLKGKPLAVSNEVVRTPYDVVWHTTALRDQHGKSLRTDFTTWNEVAEWLTRQQTLTGAWGRPKAFVPMPSTSLRALREVLPEMTGIELAARYDQAHLTFGFYTKKSYVYHHSEYENPYFTIAALLFLADGLPEDWTPTASP